MDIGLGGLRSSPLCAGDSEANATWTNGAVSSGFRLGWTVGTTPFPLLSASGEVDADDAVSLPVLPKGGGATEVATGVNFSVDSFRCRGTGGTGAGTTGLAEQPSPSPSEGGSLPHGKPSPSLPSSSPSPLGSTALEAIRPEGRLYYAINTMETRYLLMYP
jgi:hypothetical protein